MDFNSSVRNAVEQELNSGKINIPDDKKVAFLTHVDLVTGKVSGAFAVKKDSWQVGTVVDWSHDTGVEGGINVMWSK